MSGATVFQQTKALVRRKVPGVYSALRRARANGQFARQSRGAIFTRFYRTNHWGSAESYSGTGSDLVQTAEIRRQLPPLISELQCRSILDVPCGDFSWMRHLDLELDQYTGADIVSSLVAANQAAFGDDNHAFIVVDLTKDPFLAPISSSVAIAWFISRKLTPDLPSSTSALRAPSICSRRPSLHVLGTTIYLREHGVQSDLKVLRSIFPRRRD